VWQQEPQQNTTAPRGTTFNLMLVALPDKPKSTGENDHNDEKFYRTVPKLIGLTPNQASNLLGRSHLQLGNVSKGTGSSSPGTIYGQKPEPGSLVKAGSRIDVGIADSRKVPEPTVFVYVPNLLGQTQKAAEELLPQHGLSLGSVSTVSVSVQPGTVFGQFPLANTKVAQGTPVSLRIAQAVPPQKTTVPVPDLLHQDLNAARAILSQVGLQMGELTTEESDNTPNSITAQSPDAGTPVERGAVVYVVIAQQIPPVVVPNLVQRDEADAIAILQNVGLQMGGVSQQDGDANSGTILSQNPQAGGQVQKGTAVDVTVSRQVPSQLTVMVDQNNPRSGVALEIHAHVENFHSAMKYQFTFGDGQQSGWLKSSTTIHTYKSAGHYQLRASASVGDTTIESESLTVTIPPPFPVMAVAIAIGLLAVGYAAFVYQGWRLFKTWLRLVPSMDMGTQRLSIESNEGGSQSVSVRVALGIGESTVLWPAGEDHERQKHNE
jgi:beta-lactam-binding protein with PASTA domain